MNAKVALIIHTPNKIKPEPPPPVLMPIYVFLS